MEVMACYKQTEMGVIPEDWNIAILGNISVISRLAGAEYTSLWVESNNGEIIALRGFNIGKGKLIKRFSYDIKCTFIKTQKITFVLRRCNLSMRWFYW